MFGLPEKWGFIRDLRECVGKTIERVESTDLGFGYTIDNAWTVKFTDGSRAFLSNRPSAGTAILPSEKAMEKSAIFTPGELAEVVADKMHQRQQRARQEEEQERRQLAALQKKFGN